MKIDYNRNRYVAEQLVKAFPGRIIAASATTDENYDVDDIWFTSATVFDILVPHKLENKTIKKYCMKENGEFREWFRRDIYAKFENTDIQSGTPVYFINATDKYGNYDNGKWKKVVDAGACLSFLAADGILLFSPHTLKEAFMGYADYPVSHTSEFGRHWDRKVLEKKAVIDLTKGTFIPCNPPRELVN